MKQISIQITEETARQMARLAQHWGLPRERHNTPVLERAVATVYMLEIGYAEYRGRLAELEAAGDRPMDPTHTAIGDDPSKEDQR
ncbi:MAG TPA: hypothetical protein VGE07_26705 [Herpetosiphonaceae bacterium]